MSEKQEPMNDLNLSPATATTAEPQGPVEKSATEDQPTAPAKNEPDASVYDQLVWPQEVQFEPTQVEAFKQLAAQLKLSVEQAQQLVDFETQAGQVRATQQDEEQRARVRAWAEETKAFYGANLEKEVGFALRAADNFGGPELRALLEQTGLGNHPVIIRTLSQIGRAISEDVCPGGKPSAPQDKTFAEALYGTK